MVGGWVVEVAGVDEASGEASEAVGEVNKFHFVNTHHVWGMRSVLYTHVPVSSKSVGYELLNGFLPLQHDVYIYSFAFVVYVMCVRTCTCACVVCIQVPVCIHVASQGGRTLKIFLGSPLYFLRFLFEAEISCFGRLTSWLASSLDLPVSAPQFRVTDLYREDMGC